MSREQVQDNLVNLIEPFLEDMGFELLRLDYVTGKKGQLRLFIDTEDGVTIDHCEEVSRALSGFLDMQDPIPHAYTLEVSSPGLERPLTKKEHFQRFQGEKVKVKTSEVIKGSNKFSGVLQSAGSDSIEVIGDDGSSVVIPYNKIDRANLWYPGSSKG
ncbi:MAG: ribosome maturation factor RimP [Bacillota bacterium]